MNKRITKRQEAINRADPWKRALREHRVVRWPHDMGLSAFLTKEAAASAAANCEGAAVITDYQG